MKLKFGIIKERKIPADRRVVFSPSQLVVAKRLFPQASFKVESSDHRVFPDADYIKAGFEVSDNVYDCDILLGIKEVPVEALLSNKTYFIFSHTIKKQVHNKALLKAILEKNITLYDYELVVNKQGKRLLGFGRYAGIVGAYNGFRAWGLKYETWFLPKADVLNNTATLVLELKKIKVPNIKILLTGKGKVAKSVQDILQAMSIQAVSINDYLNKAFKVPVYCNIDVLDYNQRKDGKVKDKHDFYEHPKAYVSNFMRFSEVTDFYIAGHFYADGAPCLFTKSDVKSSGFNIKVVADISCDVNGPVGTTIRASTIEHPIYGYDVETETEVDYREDGAIAVMAVNNLPCELPKEASEAFGKQFLEHVMPAFFNQDKLGVLERAKLTNYGNLTENFLYLKGYVNGN